MRDGLSSLSRNSTAAMMRDTKKNKSIPKNDESCCMPLVAGNFFLKKVLFWLGSEQAHSAEPNMDVYRVNRAVYGNFLSLALTSDSFKLQFVHLLSAVITVLITNTGIMFKFCKLRFIKSELILALFFRNQQ